MQNAITFLRPLAGARPRCSQNGIAGGRTSHKLSLRRTRTCGAGSEVNRFARKGQQLLSDKDTGYNKRTIEGLRTRNERAVRGLNIAGFTDWGLRSTFGHLLLHNMVLNADVFHEITRGRAHE
jgi:hypothetical protein